MPVVTELIRSEADGSLSFGNYELDTKSKVSDYLHEGKSYKVKTFCEITKLECNETFVYESVPGTAVNNFRGTLESVSFSVEGNEDAQITLELKEGASYSIKLDGSEHGTVTTNTGGKLSFNVECAQKPVSVEVAEV